MIRSCVSEVTVPIYIEESVHGNKFGILICEMRLYSRHTSS